MHRRSSARGVSADILGVLRSYEFTSSLQRKNPGVPLLPCLPDAVVLPVHCSMCCRPPAHAVPPVLLLVPVSRSRTARVLMARAV